MKHNARAAIVDSFKQLLEKKPIDKITVKAVCEHCDVNRQTFYNHFTDIMDIFKSVYYEELSVEIAQNRTFEKWEGGFLATMHYLKRNEKLVKHIYHSSYWPEANAYFTQLSNQLLDDVVTDCAKKLELKIREKDKRFIINFYCHVFNGLMIDWVDDGMGESPEVVLQKLLLMITGNIPRSIKAFVEANIKE